MSENTQHTEASQCFLLLLFFFVSTGTKMSGVLKVQVLVHKRRGGGKGLGKGTCFFCLLLLHFAQILFVGVEGRLNTRFW